MLVSVFVLRVLTSVPRNKGLKYVFVGGLFCGNPILVSATGLSDYEVTHPVSDTLYNGFLNKPYKLF